MLLRGRLYATDVVRIVCVVREEDKTYAEWLAAGEAEKPALLKRLLCLLSQHASAIVWESLHERRPEIVNEALYKAIDKHSQFQGGSKFSTWFHRIVLNLCLDEHRLRAKLKEEPLDETVLAATDDTLQRAILGSVLENLSNEDRILVLMRMDGSTDREIARALGTSYGAVRQRWWKLKNRLESSYGVRTAIGSLGSGGR